VWGTTKDGGSLRKNKGPFRHGMLLGLVSVKSDFSKEASFFSIFGRKIVSYSRLSRSVSDRVLDISTDGDSTGSLAKFSQCLITFSR